MQREVLLLVLPETKITKCIPSLCVLLCLYKYFVLSYYLFPYVDPLCNGVKTSHRASNMPNPLCKEFSTHPTESCLRWLFLLGCCSGASQNPKVVSTDLERLYSMNTAVAVYRNVTYALRRYPRDTAAQDYHFAAGACSTIIIRAQQLYHFVQTAHVSYT